MVLIKMHMFADTIKNEKAISFLSLSCCGWLKKVQAALGCSLGINRLCQLDVHEF